MAIEFTSHNKADKALNNIALHVLSQTLRLIFNRHRWRCERRSTWHGCESLEHETCKKWGSKHNGIMTGSGWPKPSEGGMIVTKEGLLKSSVLSPAGVVPEGREILVAKLHKNSNIAHAAMSLPGRDVNTVHEGTVEFRSFTLNHVSITALSAGSLAAFPH